MNQTALDDPALREKHERLVGLIRDVGRPLVAFSGGVDSAVLAVVAHDVLSDQMLAVTAVSPSYPPTDRADAETLVGKFGFPHRFIDTNEMALEGYQRNASNRCYFCKTELFDKLRGLAQREGFIAVFDGTNASDRSDHRPGRKAGMEHGIRSPLLEAELTKDDIRAIAHARGLPTWDRPAMACLASRIAYGQQVTPERLAQVSACEAVLYEIGCRIVRVRYHGETARIEVDPSELQLVLTRREEVVTAFRQAGFTFVTLDLEGFRSGSMNTVKPTE